MLRRTNHGKTNTTTQVDQHGLTSLATPSHYGRALSREFTRQLAV